MDGLTFTVGIVNALAWPAAVVIIALVFRKQLIVLSSGASSGLRSLSLSAGCEQ